MRMVFVWMAVFGFLQVTILNSLNLLLLLVVVAALRRGKSFGFVIGAAAGCFTGIFSASTFALNILLYSVAGFLCGLVKQSIYYYKENIWTEVIFSFFSLSIFYFLYFIFTERFDPYVVSSVLVSAAVSPLIFRLVGKV